MGTQLRGVQRLAGQFDPAKAPLDRNDRVRLLQELRRDACALQQGL